jgi:hypothetical protein
LAVTRRVVVAGHFESVACLRHLERLDLSKSGVCLGDPSCLAALPRLADLCLADCFPLDLGLPASRSVTVTAASGRRPGRALLLKALAKLSGLESLDLSRNVVDGALSDLAPLSQLRRLRLAHATGLSGDLASLAHLRHLEVLDLMLCQGVTGDVGALARLGRLAHVGLRHCQGLSGDLAFVASLTRLGLLDLSWTKVRGHVTALGPVAATLHSLDLHENKGIEVPADCPSDGGYFGDLPAAMAWIMAHAPPVVAAAAGSAGVAGGGAGALKAGDWACGKCKMNNFARRLTCFGCSEPNAEKVTV